MVFGSRRAAGHDSAPPADSPADSEAHTDVSLTAYDVLAVVSRAAWSEAASLSSTINAAHCLQREGMLSALLLPEKRIAPH